jgi:hypothetical protein
LCAGRNQGQITPSGEVVHRRFWRERAWTPSLMVSAVVDLSAESDDASAGTLARPSRTICSSTKTESAWHTPEKPIPRAAASHAAHACSATGARELAPPAISTERVQEIACSLLKKAVTECCDSSAKPEDVFAPIFHSVSVPSISGSDYLTNHLLRLGLARKEHLTESVVLHAFVLIDRLLHAQGEKGASNRPIRARGEVPRRTLRASSPSSHMAHPSLYPSPLLPPWQASTFALATCTASCWRRRWSPRSSLTMSATTTCTGPPWEASPSPTSTSWKWMSCHCLTTPCL